MDDYDQSAAMGRRYQSDPMNMVNQGIDHLSDPNQNHGMDYDTKLMMIKPLLEAKHFQGPQPDQFKSGQQGQIIQPKQESSGISNIISAANKVTGIVDMPGKIAEGATDVASFGKKALNKLGILNSYYDDGNSLAIGQKSFGGYLPQ